MCIDTFTFRREHAVVKFNYSIYNKLELQQAFAAGVVEPGQIG
jgi:hypothetical protein